MVLKIREQINQDSKIISVGNSLFIKVWSSPEAMQGNLLLFKIT